MTPSIRRPASLDPQDLKKVPLAEAETMPANWYADPEFSNFDRDVIIRSSWQYIGTASRVARSGDFMVEDVGDVPVIVVHGQDGQLRCFANVCRHRGGVVATSDGHGRGLRCHYHGWSYTLEGKLAGTPHFQGKASLRPDQCQLPQYSVQTWEGLVFVNLSKSPSPFDDTFGGITERMRPLEMVHGFYKRLVFPIEANWKVYVDNYLEGYHVPIVHPELCAIIDSDQYHYELSAQYSLQHSPISSDQNPYGAMGTAFYYWIYPNIMLNIFPGRVQVNSVVPRGPNKCDVIFDFYYENPAAAATITRGEIDIKFSELVQAQDAAVCFAVHRGLASGTYYKGRLVPSQELAVQHFHDLVRETYGKNF